MIDKHKFQVGVLVPMGSTVHEAEFSRMPHDQVEFRFAGFALPPSVSPTFCAELADAVKEPMHVLRRWGADVMLLGCTTASMKCEDTPWRSRLEDLAQVPLLTAAGASREAFAALGLRRVIVATPYGPTSNAIIRDFLAASAIDIVRLEGMNLDDTVEHWAATVPSLSAAHVLSYSIALETNGSDGLYLPCTGMTSVSVIDAYEKQTGKPATSSVQAGYRSVLAVLGLEPDCPECGALLARHPVRKCGEGVE